MQRLMMNCEAEGSDFPKCPAGVKGMVPQPSSGSFHEGVSTTPLERSTLVERVSDFMVHCPLHTGADGESSWNK